MLLFSLYGFSRGVKLKLLLFLYFLNMEINLIKGLPNQMGNWQDGVLKKYDDKTVQHLSAAKILFFRPRYVWTSISVHGWLLPWESNQYPKIRNWSVLGPKSPNVSTIH